MKRVAVFGASGFVGNALVDRLFAREGVTVVPLLRSSGKAWRLAKRSISVQTVDLLDAEEVERSLQGCTHVVNCSRGDDAVMIGGLRNLLDGARKAGVKCFVHLSSVAVYGDPPGIESASEDARPPKLAKGSYGAVKLEQDEMVAKAAKGGLPSIILCPPNISGPYSPYLNAIVDGLRSGQLALVDGGSSPCNLVDVDNLSAAIELALDHGTSTPTRLFITDGSAPTWRELFDELSPLVEANASLRKLSSMELESAIRPVDAAPRSVFRSLKHVVSSDVRAALRKDPLWASIDGIVRRAAGSFGSDFEDRLRLSVEGPLTVARASPFDGLNLRLIAQQLRKVTHSCERATVELGYDPVFSFSESMDAYRRWYIDLHRMATPEWKLLQALY